MINRKRSGNMSVQYTINRFYDNNKPTVLYTVRVRNKITGVEKTLGSRSKQKLDEVLSNYGSTVWRVVK